MAPCAAWAAFAPPTHHRSLPCLPLPAAFDAPADRAPPRERYSDRSSDRSISSLADAPPRDAFGSAIDLALDLRPRSTRIKKTRRVRCTLVCLMTCVSGRGGKNEVGPVFLPYTVFNTPTTTVILLYLSYFDS